MLALLALLGVSSNVHRAIYLIILSVVLGPAAVVLGVTAMRKSRRTGTMRPRGAIAATIFGTLATVLSALFLVTLALFGSQLSTYSRCRTAAQAAAAQRACANQFYNAVNAQLSGGSGAGR